MTTPSPRSTPIRSAYARPGHRFYVLCGSRRMRVVHVSGDGEEQVTHRLASGPVALAARDVEGLYEQAALTMGS